MRIRTNIFIWVFLATVLPLTALALTATYYSQHDYQRTVRQELNTNLGRLAVELKRHLKSQRDLAFGLSRANVVQEFVPLLAALNRGEIEPRFDTYRTRINHYFEGFQTIIPGMFIMRVLDARGNTLIKVSHNKRSLPDYDTLTGVDYVEQELLDQAFARRLRQLPRGDVSVMVLPHNRQQSAIMETLPMLDYVVPLYSGDRFAGALALTLFGEEIDRLLNHAPRLYKSKLLIVENNPDNDKRHGMILFDDKNNIQLAQARAEIVHFQELFDRPLLEMLDNLPSGMESYADGSMQLYYMELFPYPNQLVSWILAERVTTQQIAAPFDRIRMVIWSSAAAALILSLILANFGVRYIARPMGQLASKLLSYARGEHSDRADTRHGIDEIRDLSVAFNTMADSLDKASRERDRAQNLMLQSAKLASIGQMAAGIGHEINNPLNNILSYSKLMERSMPPEQAELRKDLHSLREEAQRASHIVQGILNFARQVPPHFATFQVLPWLQDTLKLVRQSARTAGITLAYECEEDFAVEGDRAQLQQALINLLLNAIQASGEFDQILVQVEYNKEQWAVAVTDQGSGIAEDLLDRIYDPFFTTKPEGEGSGLGLSVSFGIIERHGGTLVIQNNLDKGVTATIHLPRKIESQDQ